MGNIVNGHRASAPHRRHRRLWRNDPADHQGGRLENGKSVSGAVWLNEAQLSHFDYWQFWRNTDDRDVGRFMRLFTDLPLDEIARLEALEGAEINEAKKVLANEATALCRGIEAAQAAAETARLTFELGAAADADLPTINVGAGEIALIAALTQSGLAASGGEAKRKIAEGAVRVDDEPVRDPAHLVTVGQVPVKLSLGKKRHALLVR